MYESYTMGAFKLNKAATLLAERLNVIGWKENQQDSIRKNQSPDEQVSWFALWMVRRL